MIITWSFCMNGIQFNIRYIHINISERISFMDEHLINFAKKVAYLRNEKHITQAKLAELVGYSPNHISKLESARTYPSFDLIVKIANALNINMRDFFDYEYDSNNNNGQIKNKLDPLLCKLDTKELNYVYKSVVNLIELRN